MRQFLQLPCIALFGLMAFRDLGLHHQAFAAEATRGGAASASDDEGAGRSGDGAPGASTGSGLSGVSVRSSAETAPSEASAPAAAPSSVPGAGSDPAASGNAARSGHPPPTIGSSSAAASFPARALSGDESALDRFREYVFGGGRPADAKRSELQRQQNLAREALSRGEIQPLDAIVRSVKNSVPGELLSARLEKNAAGAWTYRLVILSDDGRYHDVVVDAWRNVILNTK